MKPTRETHRAGADRAPGAETLHILNPSDDDLERRVRQALAHAVDGHAVYIGVNANAGEVTLSGLVATDTVRLAACAAAAEVWGVHSLADEVDVEGYDQDRTDVTSLTDIPLAIAAQRAISQVHGLPVDAVAIEVRDHVVTLNGTVSSIGERLAAEVAVTYLAGSPSIRNHIVVTGRTDSPD